MTEAKILIVEDERIVAESIRMSLQHLGYDVMKIVSSGEDAVSCAHAARPDLVLMDIVLEGQMTGIEAADQLRSKHDIPVIYITAYTDEKTLQKAKATEPFGYIVKPFEEQALRSCIEMSLYKHQMELALKESERRYRNLVETSPDAICLTDLETKIVACNRQTAILHGFERPEELIGRTAFELIDPKDRKRAKTNARKALKQGIVRDVEYTLLKKDGARFPAELTASVILDTNGKPQAFVALTRDITKRKRAEKELLSSKEELHNLTAHLESVREQERTVIAREIHDELGQVLTALKMDLVWLTKKLSKEQSKLREKTKSMTELVDTTIQTVKRISSRLRPGMLDDLGLAAAIEWQAEEFQERTGIACNITIDPDVNVLDQDRSTAMFRIFQEALTNVVRHARASSVKGTLRKKTDEIELKVRDNGQGIKRTQLSDPSSFGIIGMRERAHFLGGRINIRGVPGKGTSVTVKIPIQSKGERK